MNLSEVFPTAEQFEELDASDECNEWFEVHKRGFNRMKERVTENIAIPLPDLIGGELKDLESRRDNINPLQIATYDGIDLHPMFLDGWKCAIKGIYTVKNNCYKFDPDIRKQIENKYQSIEPPALYFEKLSKVSMEETIEGMAYAKYYYWLKEKLNNETTQTAISSKTLTIRQVALICQYENIPVTEKIARPILVKYGLQISKTTPKQLAGDYAKFNTPNQRTGEGVRITNDIKTILRYLSDNAKEMAISELPDAEKNQNKKTTE